jgi:hypothetical protein
MEFSGRVRGIKDYWRVYRGADTAHGGQPTCKANVEDVRRMTEVAMHKAEAEEMAREAEVEREAEEARVAKFEAEAKEAKCKAEAADREAEAVRVAALTLSGLDWVPARAARKAARQAVIEARSAAEAAQRTANLERTS